MTKSANPTPPTALEYSVKDCYTLRERLRADFDTQGLSWRKFAAEWGRGEMGHVILYNIYHGGDVPKWWKKRYGLVERVRPPRIAVLKGNAVKAVESLFGKDGLDADVRAEFIRLVSEIETEIEF